MSRYVTPPNVTVTLTAVLNLLRHARVWRCGVTCVRAVPAIAYVVYPPVSRGVKSREYCASMRPRRTGNRVRGVPPRVLPVSRGVKAVNIAAFHVGP